MPPSFPTRRSSELYAMQGDPALKREASTSPEAADTSVPAEQADLSAREPSTGMPRSGPNSGARVDRTLTEDGSVVTTYSPRPQIGRAHVWTTVTNAHLVCRLLLSNKTRSKT